jgi:hypothetical protein
MSAVEALFDNHLLALRTFNLEINSGCLGMIIESPLNAFAVGRLEFNITE